MSGTQFVMISDWMANGNINSFVKAHPDANRLELVGLSFSASLHLFQVRSYLDNLLAERRCQWLDLYP